MGVHPYIVLFVLFVKVLFLQLVLVVLFLSGGGQGRVWACLGVGVEYVCECILEMWSGWGIVEGACVWDGCLYGMGWK